MSRQSPHARSVQRQHDAEARAASTLHANVAHTPAANSEQADVEPAGLGPNPLWAINAGLATFGVAAALIMMLT
jgi:hypothetical protein